MKAPFSTNKPRIVSAAHFWHIWNCTKKNRHFSWLGFACRRARKKNSNKNNAKRRGKLVNEVIAPRLVEEVLFLGKEARPGKGKGRKRSAASASNLALLFEADVVAEALELRFGPVRNFGVLAVSLFGLRPLAVLLSLLAGACAWRAPSVEAFGIPFLLLLCDYKARKFVICLF